MRVQSLLNGAVASDRARLACGAPSSGSLLGTLPTASLGLLLTDSEVRIAIGLRLGVSIVEKYT